VTSVFIGGSRAVSRLNCAIRERLDDLIQKRENAEEAWREEIYRHLRQIDSEAVKLLPWDDAQRRLWARLQP
jgi:hypothetical protein